MSTSTKKNAIERRLEELEGIWNEFVENGEARILRWLADDDTARMLDLFLEIQNEEVSEIPDLFVRFGEPFQDPKQYGFQLRESLVAKYEEIREGIAEEGIAADWVCPDVRPGDMGVTAFVRACVSLRGYYEGVMLNLAIALLPHSISDSSEWRTWLHEAARSELPTNVRFLVVDDANSPLLDGLDEAEPKRFVTSKPELDMPGAYLELLREVPRSGPGLAFAKNYVALGNASTRGDLPGAQKAADAALKLAKKHNWPQLQVVVNLALGACLLASGKMNEALQSYRTAKEIKMDPEDPAAPKLAIQSRFAEAAVLVGDGQHEQAAQVYSDTHPIAVEQEDHFAELESSRMAAYCHEMAGRPEPAWKWGQRALEAGEAMDAEARESSTLPYVGQGLLRLTQHSDYANEEDNIRDRMVELVGADWESKLAQGAASS